MTDTPCLAKLARKPEGWTYETASFVDGESIPNVGEVLATGAQVSGTWARFDHALTRCRTATLQLGHATVEATVRPLALPRIARNSSAYAWHLTLTGIRIGFDLASSRPAATAAISPTPIWGRPRGRW